MELTKPLPDIAQEIKDAYEQEIKQYPVNSNYAGILGHPCKRFLVHNRLDWDKKPLIPVAKKMLFEAGKVIEKYIAKVYLEKAGYDIVEQQRWAGWKEKEIGAYLDFVIKDKNRLPDEVPVETKSMEHYDWEKIDTIEDLLFSKKMWHKNYPGQLTIYLIQKGKEIGMFLNISKRTFEPKVIWVHLDYTYAEELIQKAEFVNKCVKAREYPDRIEFDKDICSRCDFLTLCLPDIKNAGVELVEDPELESKLDRRKELETMADEYEELDESIKQPFKDCEKPQDKIIGINWRIVSKKTPSKRVDTKLMPDEVKKPYIVESVKTDTTIIDLRENKADKGNGGK